MNKELQKTGILMKNKKAQEEMIGFVLIIVLVVVVAVIILGISLRGEREYSLESIEVGALLSSISDITTSCEIPSDNYLSIDNLIIRCSERKRCDDGQETCSVLKETLKDIMDNSNYVVSEETGLNYYEVKVYEVIEDNEVDIIEPVIKMANEEMELGTCYGWLMYNYRVFYGAESRKIYLKISFCREN